MLRMLRARFFTVVGDTNMQWGMPILCGVGLELEVPSGTPGLVFMFVFPTSVH